MVAFLTEGDTHKVLSKFLQILRLAKSAWKEIKTFVLCVRFLSFPFFFKKDIDFFFRPIHFEEILNFLILVVLTHFCTIGRGQKICQLNFPPLFKIDWNIFTACAVHRGLQKKNQCQLKMRECCVVCSWSQSFGMNYWMSSLSLAVPFFMEMEEFCEVRRLDYCSKFHEVSITTGGRLKQTQTSPVKVASSTILTAPKLIVGVIVQTSWKAAWTCKKFSPSSRLGIVYSVYVDKSDMITIG